MKYTTLKVLKKFNRSYYLPIPLEFVRDAERILNGHWYRKEVIMELNDLGMMITVRKNKAPKETPVTVTVAPVSPVVSVNTTPASKPLVPSIETLNNETGELTYAPYSEVENND